MLGNSERGERNSAFARLKALRRSAVDAAVVDDTPVEGNLVRVTKPKALSLVGLPANQTGFKVLRSDEGTTPGSKTQGEKMNAVIRRTKRSDAGPVLRLTFPEGTTEEGVASALKEYGMEGYTIAQEGGLYVATRSDLKSISRSDTMDIKLSDDGLIATVQKVKRAEAEKSALVMASIEFDGSKFELEDVQRWTAEKSVDGTIEAPQNPGESYVVRRSDVPDNEETRRMVLEDGVTAVIVRADVINIPEGFVVVVNEAAYGNWGWGHLDFAAAMGDQAFSEQMRNAISTLESVLRDIVIWSALPLDVRKDLANRALAQFGEYIGTFMDSLPRQLLVSVARSANPKLENQMSSKQSGAATEQKAEVKREDGTTHSQTTTTPPETLSRADVAEMIKAAVTEALAQRSDKTETPEAKTEAKVETPATPEAKGESALTRADLVAAFTEVVKPINERLEKIEGQTVVRSEPEPTPAVKNTEETKDVFRGALPGIRGRKQA